MGRFIEKNAERFPPGAEPGDIVRGLPIPPGSCRGVYASHVIEHLPLDDAHVALRNTFALLQPGGIFRVIVPDLRYYARQYLDSQDPDAAHRFVQSTGMGVNARPRGPLGIAASLLGNARHLWMWDHESLSQALRQAGFTGLRACAPGDCEDPRFLEVEDAGRFDEAVAIECRAPA